ncbi:MAG TPA: metal ABC transporter ATP-binding protein [Gemmatimonadaceae bacterium]|nr:metal ABC transporter ATP-binding protein [Gemmatimonadaceae bacterium]
MPNALDVRHLSVAFGRQQILSDVSFHVEPGQSLAIIGPNGSGKTVLFKALIGTVPHDGAVEWAPGTKIGYVPQKLDIERDLPLTGLDFLRAKADVAGVPAAQAEQALALVELPVSIASQPIGTLSGGQFQRLLLAFALMGNPSVLLVDEPTAGVDEPSEAGIYALFGRLRRERGLTILLISHELSLVYQAADAVLCLSRRRAFFGRPMEILTTERLQDVYGANVKFHLHDDAVSL